MRKLIYVAFAFALAAGGAACSKDSLQAGVADIDSRTAASAEGDFAAKVAEGDGHWENRETEEGTRAAIAAWEEAITYDTGDLDRREALYPVYTKLAQAYYWLGHGHLFFVSNRSQREAQQQEAYETCMEFGRTSMALRNTEWNAALNEGDAIEDSVDLLEVEDTSAAYWYATCAGKWATIEGIAALLGYKDQIFALISRVAEVNGEYFYNGPDRYFGVYYTKVPFMNPDLDRSRDHFLTAIEAHPGYLETRVLFVEEYTTKTNERQVAEEQLEYVINVDIDTLPQEIRAENLRAQRHARNLLAELDEYFR